MRRVSLIASFLMLLAGVATGAASPSPLQQASLDQGKPAAGKAGSSSSSKAGTVVVNINTATTTQLEELPGIGARTAQAIVEHRQKNGPFKKIEELMNVKGIGEKSFLKLKPMVSVGAEKSDRAADRQ